MKHRISLNIHLRSSEKKLRKQNRSNYDNGNKYTIFSNPCKKSSTTDASTNTEGYDGCIENFNYQYEHPKDSFVLRIWMGTDK